MLVVPLIHRIDLVLGLRGLRGLLFLQTSSGQ
jgi:hypothetical protein